MTDVQTLPVKRPLMARMRRYLITGLVIWIPLGVTIFVFKFFIDYMDRAVTLLPHTWQPSNLFGFNIPGLGVIMVVLVLLLTGFIASNYLGRALLRLGAELLEHIPLVRSVYSTAKLPEHMVSVFVPTTPNPTSGFLLLVPQDDMIELEMTVDEALKMIISLGV